MNRVCRSRMLGVKEDVTKLGKEKINARISTKHFV
jgi:hypothetical protein